MSLSDDPAAILRVPVIEKRRPVARLLVRACVTTGSLGTARLPLRELGDAVDKSPQIFASWLSSEVIPELQTLRDLEREAGITLEEWLVAFELMPTREVKTRSIGDISPARQEMVHATEGWTEAEVRLAQRLQGLVVEEIRKGIRRGRRPRGAGR